ncbi:MAG: hypothetical protein HYY46_25875 [Deltaproteobacteria bacterium]|nr:hypothetical protein [Deltaproteobacteria bacterium]
MAIELITCNACGAKNASDRTVCLACGADLAPSDGSQAKEVNPPWAASLWQRIKTVKLNGWQRLWILVSVLWFVVVAFFTSALLPNSVPPERVYERLPKEMSAKLLKVVSNPFDIFDKSDRAEEVGISLHVDSGDTLWFRKGVTIKEAELVANTYDELLRQSLRHERIQHLFPYAFLFWVVPCAVLYALGWAIAWVRRGFDQEWEIR